ncbi:hypothetical protein R3P38DRAFT_3195616 [Favolaschia claudopus]|uniref:Uncharacterized protein n=1 Tax=Favolaschia claudopus TaxID=2862362 RepID=A0AAW0BBD3_9AGAR
MGWLVYILQHGLLGLPDHNDPKERPLTQAELDTLGTAIAERNKRIKEWYRNKTKKVRNGAGYNTSTTSMVRKILKKTVDKRQRVHHGREVFAKRNAALFEAELDKAGYNDIRAGTSRRDANHDSDDDSDDDDSHDSDADADADAGKKKKSKLMTLRGQVLGRLWGGASAEEREAVEAELTAEKEQLRKPSTSEGSKDLYETQKSIDSLDGAMGQILGSVGRETGWGIFAIAAGPNPSLGGELSMKIFCVGETPNGNDFERFCPNFTENIVQPFQDFTRICFPPAVRHALAIPTVPLPTMTDDAPVGRLYPPAAPAEEIDPPRKSKRKSRKKKATKSSAVVEDRDEAAVSAATALEPTAAMPPDPSATSVALGEHGLPSAIPAIPESGINTSTEQNVALPVEENEENVQSILGNDFPFAPSAGWVPASGVPNSTDLFHGFDDQDANGGDNAGFDGNDAYAGADYTFTGGADLFSASPIAPPPPSLNNSAFDNGKTFDTTGYAFVGGVDPFPVSPIAPRRPSLNEARPKLWFPGQEGNAAEEESGSPYRRSLLFDAFRASPVPQTPTSKARHAYPLSAISPQRTSSTTPASTFAAQVVLASIAEFTPAAAPPAQTSAPTTPPTVSVSVAAVPMLARDRSQATVAPDFATHPAALAVPAALTPASSGAAATLVSSPPVPKPVTTKIAAAPSASTWIPPRPLPKPLPSTKTAPVPAAPAATAPSEPLSVPKPPATAAVPPVPAAPAPTNPFTQTRPARKAVAAAKADERLPDSQPTNPFTQTRPARKAVAAAKADEREGAANHAQQVAAAKRRGRPRKNALTDVTNDGAAAANIVDPPASAPAAENQHLGDGYARGHVNVCHPPARNNTNRINAQKEAAATKRARENAEREAEREKREKERKQGFTERIVNGVTVVTLIRTRTEARLPDGSKFQLQPKGSRDTSTKKTAEPAARTGSKRKAPPATKAKQPAKKRAKA